MKTHNHNAAPKAQGKIAQGNALGNGYTKYRRAEGARQESPGQRPG
jgi:hypothetical protein